jgi:hypothetical protein
MKEDREPYEVEVDVTAYLDHGRNDTESPLEPITVTAKEIIWAAAGDHEKRELNGKLIPVVRFIRGLAMGMNPVWYWLPYRDFERVAKKTDVKSLTSAPNQR